MMYRYMKTRMTRGSIVLRQKYFMANTVDHYLQLSTVTGFGTGAQSVTRLLAQDLMVVPAITQAVAMLQRAPVIGKRIPPDILERFRKGISYLGDRGAWLVGSMFGAAKYRIEVNPILEGAQGSIVVGDKVYTIRELRNIAVEEGIFASFDTRELQKAILNEGELIMGSAGVQRVGPSSKGIIRSVLGVAGGMMEDVRNISEAWSERERIGAMVTLIEQGFDPRVAARLTIDALYDYSQSMTKADRSWIVGILFPFWAFQKNANQQVVNLAFSTQGAYRMMCIQRARMRGSQYLTEVLYNEVGDEYGVDVKSMPPELQDSYAAIITKVEEMYPDGVPMDVKMALRILLSGRPGDIYGGKEVQLTEAIRTMRASGAFADLSVFEPFTALRPQESMRASYMRDRPGIAISPEKTEATRFYYSLVGSDDHSYIELMFPETFIEGGMRHIAYVAAGYFTLAAKGAAGLGLAPRAVERGINEVNWFTVVSPVVDPQRSPILGPMLAELSTGALSYPKQIAPTFVEKPKLAAEQLKMVHPTLGKMIDDAFGTTFLRVPAVGDPIALAVRNGEDLRGISEERMQEIRELQKTYPSAGELKRMRYYLPGGGWATAFENSPLGELNNLLLRNELSPMEKLTFQTKVLGWTRMVTGVDVTEVSGERTARMEEPTKLKTTKEM